MNAIRRRRPTAWLLLGAALLLRASIPLGYMPAAGGQGLLYEFCPEGVPVEFMRFLSGEHGQHHHHQDHGNEVHHCPVGHALLSAFAIDDRTPLDIALADPVFAATPAYSFTSSFRAVYNSRGPPA